MHSSEIGLVDTGNGCIIGVDMKGPPVQLRWHDIWAEAVAVAGMCMIYGDNGYSNTTGTRYVDDVFMQN